MAKILIADDMVTVQHNLMTIVTSLGHQVVGVAKNSIETLHLYHETKPDLVILDILGMKIFDEELGREIDTFDVIELLLKENQNARIIILTASPKEEYIKKALLLGAKSFLVKGVSVDKIEATLNSVLQK